MSRKVHYTQCPVCESKNIKLIFTVTDNTVSGEGFEVWQCNNCSLRFTQDVPDRLSIQAYYQSKNYISHTNTKKGAINKLYQVVRKYTLNQKANLVIEKTQLKTGSILDVGCGTGAFLHTMRQKGWQVTGVEPDAQAREVGKQLYGFDVSDTNILQELPNESFNAITLWHVLEHVHHLNEFLQQIKSLMKKEGKLFIAVPNYQSADAQSYKRYWAAYDVPRHLYHFTPKAMEMLLEKNEAKIFAKKPMWFDSFYISLLSSKYKNGFTNWPAAFLNGLRSNLNAVFNIDKCSSVIYVVEKT